MAPQGDTSQRPRSSLWHACRRILRGIWRRAVPPVRIFRERILAVERPDDIQPVEVRADLAICDVTAENVGQVEGFRGPDIARVLTSYLEAGQYGAYAMADGEVVGHVWAMLGSATAPLLNGYLPVPEGQAAVHFGRVREDFRGNRLLPAMMARVCTRAFREAGVDRVLVNADLTNTASLRAIERMGFRPREDRAFLLVFGKCVRSWPIGQQHTQEDNAQT